MSASGPTAGTTAPDEQARAAGIRSRRTVAASILGVILVAGYFATTGGGTEPAIVEYLIHGAVLAIAFWFPAVRLGTFGDVREGWRSLAVWLLAWTLAWDLATAGIGTRTPFQEWWLVYPSGVLVLLALLALHVAVVRRVAARTGAATA